MKHHKLGGLRQQKSEPPYAVGAVLTRQKNKGKKKKKKKTQSTYKQAEC